MPDQATPSPASTVADGPAPDMLTLDPVALHITNRVAAGSLISGSQQFEGGLLVQGTLSGTVRVHGRLVIWAGAVVRGQVVVMGDAYIFGHLGEQGADPQLAARTTQLECMGTAYVAGTATSTGTLMAQRLQMYEGANLQGPFKTLRSSRALPVLNEKVCGWGRERERGIYAKDAKTDAKNAKGKPKNGCTHGFPPFCIFSRLSRSFRVFCVNSPAPDPNLDPSTPPKYRRPHPHDGAARVHCRLQIGAHAHRERVPPLPARFSGRNLLKYPKCQRKQALLRYKIRSKFRDAHDAAQLQAG